MPDDDDSYKFLKDMREKFIKLDDNDLRNEMNMVTFISQFNQSPELFVCARYPASDPGR